MKAKVLTEEQAAKQMLISGGTLGRWRREGKIRHYRQMGSLIRYTPEDVDLNIAERAANRPKVVSPSPVSEARFG